MACRHLVFKMFLIVLPPHLLDETLCDARCIDGTVKQGAVQLISINIPRTVKTDILKNCISA